MYTVARHSGNSQILSFRSTNWLELSNLAKMIRKVSFYFTVMSKELHTSLASVKNVRGKEKMKEVADGKLPVVGLTDV